MPIVPAAALAHVGVSGAAAASTRVPGLFGTRGEPPVGQVITFGAGSAWVLSDDGVARLDEATDHLQAEVSLPRATQLAFSAGHLWAESVVLGVHGYRLSEVSPATDRVMRVVIVGNQLQQGNGHNYQALAAEGSRLYLEVGVESNRPQLFVLDARTGRVPAERHVPRLPLFAQVGGTDVVLPGRKAFRRAETAGQVASATVLSGRLWATPAVTVQRPSPSSFGTFAWRLQAYDAHTGTSLRDVTPDVWQVSAGDGQLWGLGQPTAPGAKPYLVEIGPSGGAALRRYNLPQDAGGTNPSLAVATGAVWAVFPETGTVYRLSLAGAVTALRSVGVPLSSGTLLSADGHLGGLRLPGRRER